MKKQNTNLGITLIALVITIIALLILAGVSIAMLTGENGILTQAQNAKIATEMKSAEEKVKLAVLAARSDNGVLTIEKLRNELANFGTSVSDSITEFPIYVENDGKYFYISESGNVESRNLITFKVNKYYTFTAVEGMTFSELLNSDMWKKYRESLPDKRYSYIYASDSKVSFSYVGYNGGYEKGDLALNKILINVNDKIIEGMDYSLNDYQGATDY